MNRPRWLVALRRADRSLAVSAYQGPETAYDCAVSLAIRAVDAEVFLLDPEGTLRAVPRPAMTLVDDPELTQAIRDSAVWEQH